MKITKTIIGAVAAALLTTAVASPAEARHRRYEHRRGNGISLGDVVLGTIAVAGVATAVGALSSGRRYENGRYNDRRYDDRNRGGRYGGFRDDEGSSVQACTYAAEREAGRRFGSAGRVEIQDVDTRRDGYSVRGTVLVQDSYSGNRYYDRGRSGRVAFSCTAAYGEVTGLSLGSSYAGY